MLDRNLARPPVLWAIVPGDLKGTASVFPQLGTPDKKNCPACSECNNILSAAIVRVWGCRSGGGCWQSAERWIHAARPVTAPDSPAGRGVHTGTPHRKSLMFHSSSSSPPPPRPRKSKHRWAYYIITTIKLMSWILSAHIHFTPMHRHCAQTQAADSEHRKFPGTLIDLNWTFHTFIQRNRYFLTSLLLIEVKDYVATSAAVGVNKVWFKVTNMSLYLNKQC